jgi:tetratricopeptide (TPR) repeat protein
MTQHKQYANDHTLMELERHMSAHPFSTAFTRIASAYLDRGRPALALKACLQGLKRHSSYPVALLMMARAQVMLRQYNDARETLDDLRRAVPGCHAATALLHRLTELELAFPPATMTNASFASVERSRSENERWSRGKDLLPAMPVHSGQSAAQPSAGETHSAQTLDLSQLAARLEGARIPPLSETIEEVDTDESDMEQVQLHLRPQTETLARIYVSQGRYKEAIDAYQSILRNKPDRATELSEIMEELRSKLET